MRTLANAFLEMDLTKVEDADPRVLCKKYFIAQLVRELTKGENELREKMQNFIKSFNYKLENERIIVLNSMNRVLEAVISDIETRAKLVLETKTQLELDSIQTSLDVALAGLLTGVNTEIETTLRTEVKGITEEASIKVQQEAGKILTNVGSVIKTKIQSAVKSAVKGKLMIMSGVQVGSLSVLIRLFYPKEWKSCGEYSSQIWKRYFDQHYSGQRGCKGKG